MESINKDHPLRHLFAGLVEHAFCAEVGLCAPRLTDYVAGLLVDFTHVDRFRVIRDARGKRLEQIAAMLALMCEDLPASRVERDRIMYRRIGDYSLFWAGVFPEHLKRSEESQPDVLLSYVSQGKQSYAIVSQLTDEDDVLPASLFRHLSEDFEFCLYGLGLVRRGWEKVERRGGRLLY
jgi:hypothetical protein